MGPSEPVSDFSLYERLQSKQIEWPPEGNQYFIPNKAIDSLVTYENVCAELTHIYGPTMDDDQRSHYATGICAGRKKLFVILCVSITMRQYIRNFVDEGLTDSDLPFIRVPTGPSTSNVSYMLCSTKHVHNMEQSPHPCAISAMSGWTKREIGNFCKDFCRDQWMVLAPVFERIQGQIPHYNFDNSTIMPFSEDYEKDKKYSQQGGYSNVWAVRISAGHQDLYQSRDVHDSEPLLAVKQLFSTDPDHFKQETDMLKALTDAKHNHIVELLATYKYKDRYHLLFPYASANLRTLWGYIPIPYWNKTTYLWVLDQMTSLAAALNVIHTYQSNVAYKTDRGNPGLTRFKTAGRVSLDVAPGEEVFGRHGDLKPENILWLSDIKSPSSAGILQITDLGLGHFHRLDSRSRIDPTKLGGSQTYIPPELPLNRLVSRKYDIWSLGCVFLEFITWLLKGSAGLEEFNNSRLEIAPDTVEDDTYYTVIPSPEGVPIRAIVRNAVTSWIKNLHESPRCSKLVHEVLDLLENRLLVVDSNARITALDLYSELRERLDTSRKNPEYLVGENPEDEGAGFKMPNHSST